MKPKLMGWLLAVILPVLMGQTLPASSPPTVRLAGTPTPGAWFPAQLIASETSTTQGRPLRIYDQHIAQMFAVTGGLCRQFPKVQGWRWDYRAGGGTLPMGEFRIPCDMADTMLESFGKGRTQTIPVQIGKQSQNLRVTPLNLTGEQIPRWLEVTANFRPWVNSAGQVRQIMSALKPTKIPVFLPSEPLQAGGIQLFFTNEAAKPNSYEIGLYVFPGCTAGACTFGSLRGERGGKLSNPSKEFPKDTYEKVTLAGGVRGQFVNSCGAYCTAMVEWVNNGVLYQITGKNADRDGLVRYANTAIQAGAR
ncbi:hypothetical protein GlitD10_0756 [Gloeomargarita lithophora Alchichica-D10]|uniref:Uncharacterized protein n=1 Tax=Gloeomargarita lithophora Alchichica-D10 TaxID=1188229 RepID=A0A1J0AAW3_9CYAN|nr:hypothetical protein [Gloeomargarita lithophora]APB33070.1 hypothetical protein GlitD10_0756 [Gloeomargarita lithophora Alchichica-D10]